MSSDDYNDTAVERCEFDRIGRVSVKRNRNMNMNNSDFYEAIDKYISYLKKLREEGVTIAKNIIGDNLTKDDLFFCSSLDRCLHLIDGIIILLKERNLTCAGAILRLQMDNCLRTYAAFIARDKARVIDCLIYGTPIKNEKDTNGNKMTDAHLKKEISKVDNRFEKTYDQASGYIHLSDKAFYQTVRDIDKNGMITLQVGHELPEKSNDALLECADTFCRYVDLHYNLLKPVVESKRRYDAEQKVFNEDDTFQ